MKVSTSVWLIGFVLLVFGVQEGCSLSGFAGFSTFFLAVLSGFLLGKITLTTFIMFLMAVTPPEAQILKRGIRSVPTESVPSLPEIKNASASHQSRKLDGRFLQNLIARDPLNCLPQLLCSAASSPTTKAEDIINDYQFLMNEVLQQTNDKAEGKESSGYHNIFTKLENYNDVNANRDDEDKDSDEKESDEELDKIFDLMALKEKSELEDQMYSELVDDDPENLGFVMADINESRKRNKFRTQKVPIARPATTYDDALIKAVTDPDLKMLFDRFKPRVSRNLDTFRERLEENKAIQARNPRMEKLAYFSKKQRELRQAKSIDEKFRIASDVGQKYRSGRQCRRLFNTCPFQPNTLSRLVNNLRRVLTGTPTHNSKQTGSLTNNGKGSNSILSASTEPGTNVQVVVNLGSEFGGGLGSQAAPVTSAPANTYQNLASPVYQVPPLVNIPISVPHAYTTKAPAKFAMPTYAPVVNYQNFMNTLMLPSPTPASAFNYLHNNIPPIKYQTPVSQTYPFLLSATKRTTAAPKTTTRTAKPSLVVPSTTNADSLLTKPFLENFLNYFNRSTTPEPELALHTAPPININNPLKESQKTKQSSGENFSYSFSRPTLDHNSTITSTTTEKGYLLPVGFDVDPGTRRISSPATTSTEFVTTTLSEGLEEDGTWTPIEHIFTHPNEGSGDEFLLQRQPPKKGNSKSKQKQKPNPTFTHGINNDFPDGFAHFPVPHQSQTQTETENSFIVGPAGPVAPVPTPESDSVQTQTKSPHRLAAEAFLKQIMNGQHNALLQSTTILTTTAKPKIFHGHNTNNRKPVVSMAPGDYLEELEVAFKLPKPNSKEKATNHVKANSKPGIPNPALATAEAEQRESDELLTFIRNMAKENLYRGKPQKKNVVKVSEPDPDPDMKEIDEVIKLLDEQSREKDDEKSSEEEDGHIRPGMWPQKVKGNKKIPSKAKGKKPSKVTLPSPAPAPKKATTTTTTTTPAPSIITDMNEVISLLNNEEKKTKPKPKPKAPRSRNAKGNRKNSKVTRTKKRKPKPSSEESSEEEFDNGNELPPSFINRYRQIQLSRPLIAVPYRREDTQDSEEDDSPPEPPSPVQALTKGVYSFLFSGVNKNNQVSSKPSMQRYIPFPQQNQHSYDEVSDEDEENPYIPKHRKIEQQFRQKYRAAAPRISDFRRQPSFRPNRFYSYNRLN